MTTNNKHINQLSEKDIRKIMDKSGNHKFSEMDKTFMKDALEGYQQNPDAIHELNDLKKTAYNRLKFRSFSLFSRSFLFKTISILVVVGLITFAYSLFHHQNPENSQTLTLLKSINNKTNHRKTLPQKNEVTEKSEEKTLPTLHTVKQDHLPASNNFTLQKVNSLYPEKIGIPDIKKKLDRNILLSKYATNGFPISYMMDLKVVNYDKFRITSIDKNEFLYNHLESEYENYNDKENALLESENRYVSYKLFLKRALGKVKNKDYAKALSDFSTILKQYPDDVNAFFYSGLCFYYLNNYSKAIYFFDKSATNIVNAFDEESEWYKALSLEKSNQKDVAIRLFKQIYDKGGFYAEKAKEKINSQ